jgi:hypothetical protein
MYYKAIEVSDIQEFYKIFAIRCEKTVGKLTCLKKRPPPPSPEDLPAPRRKSSLCCAAGQEEDNNGIAA